MGWDDLPDRVPDAEADGAFLESPTWMLDGDVRLASFFEAIRGVIPADAVVYLEGRDPEDEFEAFLNLHGIPERLHIAFGTIWPRPEVWHLPASEDVLSGLTRLLVQYGEQGFPYHVHLYDGDGVLLWWHDAGVDPMRLSIRFGEDNMQRLATRLNVQGAVQQRYRADGQKVD